MYIYGRREIRIKAEEFRSTPVLTSEECIKIATEDLGSKVVYMLFDLGVYDKDAFVNSIAEKRECKVVKFPDRLAKYPRLKEILDQEDSSDTIRVWRDFFRVGNTERVMIMIDEMVPLDCEKAHAARSRLIDDIISRRFFRIMDLNIFYIVIYADIARLASVDRGREGLDYHSHCSVAAIVDA